MDRKDNPSACKYGGFFGVASSPWLCRLLQDLVGPIPTFTISPVDVLRPFGMDRVGYGQDLARCGTDAVGNWALHEIVAALAKKLEPDTIISFTQNRYLASLSPNITTIFSELQPLPRTIGTGFFIDHFGHQTESLLVRAAQRIRSLKLPVATEVSLQQTWSERFTTPNRDHPETADMLAWFKRVTDGSRIAMFAMQPPDWLAVEGLSRGAAPEDFLLAWLDALPAGWQAVATYHPGHQLPRALEKSIAEQMPNFLLLPEVWKQGRSEWLLQAVDAVVTISSAVGWCSLLAAKRSVTLGRSNLTEFSTNHIDSIDAPPLTSKERVNLMSFLMSRYCIPESEFLDKPGYLIGVISEIKASGEEYFFNKLYSPSYK